MWRVLMEGSTRAYFWELLDQFTGEFPEVIDEEDKMEISLLDTKFYETGAQYDKNVRDWSK